MSALARADSAWVAGDQAAALFDYERVLAAAAPGSYSPRLRARHAMATELFGNNDAAAARALLEAHLEKYPGDDEARRDLALACFQDRNFDCARQAAIAATNKGTSQDRARTAKYALYAGDFEAAAAESSAVLDVDANNVRSRLTLAALAILKQQPQLAAAEYALVRAAGANELAAAGMLDVDYFLGDAGTAATTDAGQVVLDTAGVAPQSAAQPSDIDSLRALSEAIDKQDHWLLRYERGKVYLRAGYFAEALDEFTECSNRIGEASALFLDDKPTLRVAGELPYWLARAQAELGMAGAAAENFRRFIERRPADPLADDARQRIN